MEPEIIGLFEGYGGLTMATQAVLGGHLIAYSEIEPAACRVLAHHNPGVPNLGDVTRVGLAFTDEEWAAMQRRADADDDYELPAPDWLTLVRDERRRLIVAGGFPCTDVSLAGRRAGLKPGTRSGLWAHMAYAIGQLRPDLVVIENVRGLLSAEAHCDLEPCPWCVGDRSRPVLRALGVLLGDLASLGYVGRWCGLRASDVGAPHERFRVFVIAWPAPDSDGIGPVRGGRTRRGRGGSEDDGLAVADAPSDGRHEGRPESTRVVGGSDAALGGAPSAADTPRAERREPQPEHLAAPAGRTAELGERAGALAWGEYGPAIRRWERVLGSAAPAPTMTGARGGQQLSPRFVEFLMGLPEGWVTDVPGLSRNEQLKLLGNGVVPAQAKAALRHLLSIEMAA